ncbi:MAG: phage holin family protein [Hyphomicrobiaceae bacterium]|nr:phage holin family protein [Hyphomicrobiaceae bacterium]
MANDNPSIPDLISTALGQASRLIRDEVQLAKAEMSANVTDAVRPVGFLIGGACVVMAALVMLLAALAAFLVQQGWSDPASKLLAALCGAGLGSVLFWLGVSRLGENSLMPARTVQQVREDVTAVKEHL